MMHRCRRTFFALLGFIAIPVSAFGQTVPAPGSPDAVVRGLLNAMEANDAARIRAAFSLEAWQAYGSGTPKSGPAFSRWLQTDIIAAHGRVENPSFTTNGEEVIVTGRYRNNAGYSSAADFLFKVSNGQIVSWQMRY